ncbi:MAG: serine hydrolase [Chthoniobacterales bacterium]
MLLWLAHTAIAQPDERKTAEQAVRQLERAWLDAYEQNDLKAMDAIVADDFIITFPSGRQQTKAQIIESIKTPRGPAGAQKFRTEEVQARVYGDTVILTGRLVSESQRENKSSKEHMLYTDTYVRRTDGWQVVASHLSNVDKNDGAVREVMAKRQVAGASVAVVRDGKLALARGYGSANIEKSLPATPETVYQIGSTTKPFTALAIMMLVEQGRIALDDKAAKHLPKLPASCREITVRQLLTHTSGVNRDLRTENADDFSIDDFWRRLANAAPSFIPGEKWEYSNTGYILLGLIIEAVAGKPLGDFLQERIFKPLGMQDTSYLASPGQSAKRAIGYEWVDNAFRPSPYFSGGFGAGGLVSSVTDLARWSAALETEKLLKRSSVAQMWAPATLKDGKAVSFEFRGQPASYGFGWFLTSYRGRKLITHGGTLSGFSSQVLRFPDEKITIIVNSNSKAGADRIGHAELLAQSVAQIHVPNLQPVSHEQ